MTVTLEEAQSHLAELIAQMKPGEPIVITRGEKPVAQLVPAPEAKPRPQFGSSRGKLVILVEDDEHLKDFQDYLP